MSQGCEEPLATRKSKKTDSVLELPEGNATLPTT